MNLICDLGMIKAFGIASDPAFSLRFEQLELNERDVKPGIVLVPRPKISNCYSLCNCFKPQVSSSVVSGPYLSAVMVFSPQLCTCY